MIMKSTFATFVLVVMLSACAPRAATAVVVEPHDPLLCAIEDNPGNYDGKEVVLSAGYRTDNRHFETLHNPNCSGGGRILDIGRHGGSAPVARFYAEQKRLCLKRGASALCNTAAVVEVSGRVRLKPEGGVFFDLEDVRSFRFEE
ncbi:TPA: hypothetical protein QDZ47_002290 [Stenotrophomonas maltophilia]|nr:hypothetical protein [Stenotrophomonas maltophilia]